ncbi:DUF3152 domain-containing protein [Phytohabitans sp. ZYX-F-186]|uniref:DUF3152 domain-containing protein n=2 Tax=Phytohabitans maris TaxID=3071409 RepID=A0ABU0ZBN3_9ACTN|nr:DUF3152 domain-containing protein [Phytohabitans sp. ZYX-F-186]MDQ7904474.1 DUF3152 domain-containing protein [Phytohabitans sp. ZYX-F-186]
MPQRPVPAAAPATPPAPAPPYSSTASPPAPPPPEITYPARGAGTWRFAAGGGPLAGRSGQLMRYRVAVERGIDGIAPDAFAVEVTRTLSDPRSWTGDGRWRLQRVGNGSPYDFTVYLTTPGTRDDLCPGDDGYTSCRNGERVVLNVARWVHGVPRYGAPLDAYRQYLVNHEVGHRLGHGHEKCPGLGRPAPVMQQQTLGLHGCVAYGWPLLDGRLYRGPAGSYDDPVPEGA